MTVGGEEEALLDLLVVVADVAVDDDATWLVAAAAAAALFPFARDFRFASLFCVLLRSAGLTVRAIKRDLMSPSQLMVFMVAATVNKLLRAQSALGPYSEKERKKKKTKKYGMQSGAELAGSCRSIS